MPSISVRNSGTLALHIACFLILLTAGRTWAVTLPAKWKQLSQPQDTPVRTYEATGLPDGQFATVRDSGYTPLAGESLEQWTLDGAKGDVAPEGVWATQPTTKRQNSGLVTTGREFVRTGGGRGMCIYFGVGGAHGQGRILRASFSSEAILRGPNGEAARELIARLIREEPADSRQPPRGSATPTPTQIITSAEPRSDRPAAAPPQSPVKSFPFATSPGAGVPDRDVETVFYHWDQRYDAFQGLQMTESAYLLFKDGTVYDSLPVPPQDFDKAASMRSEPTKWGKWRKQGSTYSFAWSFAPSDFVERRGNPVARSKPGTTLDGIFTGASTYTLPGGSVSSWTESSMTLKTNGRFEMSRSGGSSAKSGDTYSNSYHDDEKSVSSSSTPSAAVQSRGGKVDIRSRQGSYTIDGYSIVLKYDDGKTERRPFFIDDGGAGIWMFGTRLMRKK